MSTIKRLFKYLILTIFILNIANGSLFAQKKNAAKYIIKDTASATIKAAMTEEDVAVEENKIPFLNAYFYAAPNTTVSQYLTRVKNIGYRASNRNFYEKGSKAAYLVLPAFPSKIYLSFIFRNDHEPDRNGNILEYKLLNESKVNKNNFDWIKSTNPITITKLESNTRYLLVVRYLNEQEKYQTAYSFRTQAWWERYWRYFKKKMPIFLLLFVLINIFLLWRFLDTKRRNRQYQLELKSLFAQLNPHFLFNSLSSIQGLINNNEIEKANQYLSGFSGLLRATLEKGTKEYITLEEEMENLNNYIHFEQLRFDFQYDCDIEPYLPINDIKVLPLLAQPIIENSVKHGIGGMGNNGILSIRIYTVNRDLFFAVKDNGKGFDVEDYKVGYGVALVKKRIEAYNRWHRKSKIYFNMKSVSGNTVNILQYENWLPK